MQLSKIGKLTGWLYVAIIIGSVAGGVLTELYLQSALNQTTASEINGGIIPEWVFRGGFFAYFLVAVSEIATTAALFFLFEKVDRPLAVLSALFRFAEAMILAANLINQYNAFLILNGAEYLSAFQPNQQTALASAMLATHRSVYLIGQVFFGLHCLFLGLLIVRSIDFPKIIGVFFTAAAFGYLIESIVYFLHPDFSAVEAVISWISAVPAIFAELSFTYWLLFKTGKNRKLTRKMASKETA